MELLVRHQRHGHLDAAAFDLGGPAGHVAQEVDGQLHVHHPRHLRALAVVQALQLGQLLGVALHQVGEFPQQVLAFARTHAAPRRVVEGLAGGPHGAVDVFRCGRGHLAEHRAGGRVAEAHGGAVGGVQPLPADQHLQLAGGEGAGLRKDGQVGGHDLGPRWLALRGTVATAMPRPVYASNLMIWKSFSDWFGNFRRLWL
ncbi:hypothetical protein D9M70_466930 [compost metagenome]